MNSVIPSAWYSAMRCATSACDPTSAVPAPPRTRPTPAHRFGATTRRRGVKRGPQHGQELLGPVVTPVVVELVTVGPLLGRAAPGHHVEQQPPAGEPLER